jgi:Protein of unknown function (DUF3379)
VNCLETRRRLQADPRHVTAPLQSHLAQCEGCSQFAARIAREETLLREALAVPVPEMVHERVLLNIQLTTRSSPLRRGMDSLRIGLGATFRKEMGVALAAAAMISLVLVVVSHTSDRGIAWSDIALAHVLGEPSALSSDDALPIQPLVAALRDYGLHLNGNLGTLRYFDHYPLPGGRGVHAVVDMPGFGRVTLILPPLGVEAKSGKARREGYAADVVRIERAAVAVVTDRPDRMDLLARTLEDRLKSQL